MIHLHAFELCNSFVFFIMHECIENQFCTAFIIITTTEPFIIIKRLCIMRICLCPEEKAFIKNRTLMRICQNPISVNNFIKLIFT